MTIAAPQSQLLALYEEMLLIRVFETEAERQYKAAKIGGYCHLSSGQEATCIGAVRAMHEADLLVTGYRCHGFALARGIPPEAVMAELFGRRDGCAHGRGGSMHLLDVSRGYYGGLGLVGGPAPPPPRAPARLLRPPAGSRSASSASSGHPPSSASSGTARSTSGRGTSR